MARDMSLEREQLDIALKALTVFTRSVDQVLVSGAIKAAGDRLSESKVQLLKLILHQGPQTQGQIARYLGVTHPAASQLADALGREKLITRKPDKNDRRVAYLCLTPQGRKRAQAIEREQHARLRAALRDSGTKSVARFAAGLESLARSLAKTDPDGNGFCLQCLGHRSADCVRADQEPSCDHLANVPTQMGSSA